MTSECHRIQRLLDEADAESPALDEELTAARVEEHIAGCDDCAAQLGALLAERSGASIAPDRARLDTIFERVLAEFLNEDDPIIRRRASDALERRRKREPATRAAIARAVPSPKDYRHIALAASLSLRQGPMSTMARLVRELTPYLRAYTPDLYILEGSFQMLLRCGLLRAYPVERLHCLAPGTLGGLTDLGAGLSGGPVVGMKGVFDEDGDEIAGRMDLDWKIDCVLYLIDPLDAASTQPETLSLKRECAVTNTPFLDTYTSAVEFFGLLGAATDAPPASNALPADLHDAYGYARFPHTVLALIAHDANKEALLGFARDNIAFMKRFDQRIGTETTAALLNGVVPDRMDKNPTVKYACELLGKALDEAEVAPGWVDGIASGREGGNLQIGEAVAMGICDSVIVFEEPRPRAEYGITHQLIERNARLSNHPDRLNTSGRQMLVHDPRSAEVWAQLWGRFPQGGPVTLETTYRETFGVELVLADLDDGESTWEAITNEAAWYLLSAIAMNRLSDEAHDHTRVTVACGPAMCDIVDNIGASGVATALFQRIHDHHSRDDARVEACKTDYPRFKKRIEQLAQRRKLTLFADPADVALWSIGSVTVAPMVGRFGSGEDRVEATAIARNLARTLEGEALQLDATAFTKDFPEIRDDLRRHWATSDIAIVTCGDLSHAMFTSAVPVPLQPGMYDDLKEKGATGEVAGIYLNADGGELRPDPYKRHGMRLADLQRIVKTGGGSASIMVAGAAAAAAGDGPAPPRVSTVLAAMRAEAVSALVSDPEFATAVLREHARTTKADSLDSGEPTYAGSGIE